MGALREREAGKNRARHKTKHDPVSVLHRDFLPLLNSEPKFPAGVPSVLISRKLLEGGDGRQIRPALLASHSTAHPPSAVPKTCLTAMLEHHILAGDKEDICRRS
jgi:hypothetical protein